MPKVSRAHVDARRRQILAAAVRCFSQKGIHPTTMQDLVRESGLSAGAIYSYFSGKDEIIRAIADERHDWERRAIRAALAEEDAGKSFQGLVHTLFRTVGSDDEKLGRRVGIEMWAEALHDPSILRVTREGVDEPLRILTARISEAQERGAFAPHLAPGALARVGVALFQGFLLQQAWDEDVDLDSYVAVLDWLLDQLERAP